MADKALIRWLPHGPRIAEAFFKASNKKIDLRVILAYAPTEDKDADTKDEFYEQLDKVYRDGHKEKSSSQCFLENLTPRLGAQMKIWRKLWANMVYKI